MPLKPYEEFAQEPLAFPVNGKVYTVPPLGYTDGILLQRTIAGEQTELTDAPAEAGWQLVMGSAWDEMVADKVPLDAQSRAGFAAMTDFQFGREAAIEVWESGLDPKALAESVQRALERQTSSSTGEETETPSLASSSGTTSPKTTKRAPAKRRKSASST